MFSLGFEKKKKKKNHISPKPLLSIKQISFSKKNFFPGMLSKTASKPMLESPFEFRAYFCCVCDCAGLPNNKIGARRTDKLI